MSRYALCIGINAYPGAELSGCVNDAKDWQNALSGRGYDVDVMLDSEATLSNMREAMLDLVHRARYGDRIVLTFSGHGTYRFDPSGDEYDRRDEAICPSDVFSTGSFYDDEIGAIFSNRRFGVRAFIVSDSCYSGTVSRLADFHDMRARAKFLPPHVVAPRTAKPMPRGRFQGTLLLSGCADNEVSYDAWFGDRPNGAMTRVALDTLAHQPKTYKAWHDMIRTQLPSDEYPQTPQLDGSMWRKRWATLV